MLEIPAPSSVGSLDRRIREGLVALPAQLVVIDRATGEVLYGRVPPGSVVVPGSLPAPDGTHTLACAVIVKRVDAQTRAKTSINELLRA